MDPISTIVALLVIKGWKTWQKNREINNIKEENQQIERKKQEYHEKLLEYDNTESKLNEKIIDFEKKLAAEKRFWNRTKRSFGYVNKELKELFESVVNDVGEVIKTLDSIWKIIKPVLVPNPIEFLIEIGKIYNSIREIYKKVQKKLAEFYEQLHKSLDICKNALLEIKSAKELVNAERQKLEQLVKTNEDRIEKLISSSW